MSHKYIKQDGIKDCGVCCLYNIIKHYGGNIDFDYLKSLTKTNQDGTNIYNIVSTSEKLGLKSNAYRCKLDDLYTLTLPLIAHLNVKGKCYHYVIIEKIKEEEIIIFDPIRGKIKYQIEDFLEDWTNIIITFQKTNNLVNENINKTTKYIFEILKKYKKVLFIVIVLVLISSLFSNINSLYLSKLYNNKNKIFSIFIQFFLLLFLKVFIDYIKNTKLIDFNNKFDMDITSTTFNKILSLPIKFHHERPVGDILSRFNDLSSIKEFLYNFSFTTIVDVLFLIIINIFIFIINCKLSLINIIFTILYFLIYLYHRNNLFSLINIIKEDYSSINSLLVESIFGIDTIKNLNIEKEIKNKYSETYNNYLSYKEKLDKTTIKLSLILNLVSGAASLIIILFGIFLFKNNNTTLSKIITLNTLIIYYYISLNNIISLDEIFVKSKEAVSRINKILKNKIISHTTPSHTLISINKINFSNINYSYNDVDYILKDTTFSINKGEYVFINGKSGVGKSTIFKLLTKQLESKKNTIFINEIDINELKKEDIDKNILYVSQNEYLFTDSIKNNIKMYENIDENLLNKIIKITKIDEIISKRNIDLDFILEENGCNLSGGERQKIILARSLIRNKNILILDETMNEIDPIAEREIIKKIKESFDITLVLISHRTVNSDLFNKTINL